MLRRAPFQLKLQWMWLVWQSLGVPSHEYDRQPSDWRDEAQIWRFQMMYMMPMRRAMACRLPCRSVAIIQLMMSVAMARSPESVMSSA